MSQAWYRPSITTPPRRNPAPIAANDDEAWSRRDWMDSGAIVALGLLLGVLAWALCVGGIYLAIPLS